EASNAGPLALHPLPRFGGHSLRKETTRLRCTRFQDHPVLETIPLFRIIRGLEYAAAPVSSKRLNGEAARGIIDIGLRLACPTSRAFRYRRVADDRIHMK